MFYVYLNEQQSGPYTKEQIIGMIKEGSLDSAYIYGENYPDWVHPRQTEEFKDFFNAPSQTPRLQEAPYPIYFYYNERQYEIKSSDELSVFLNQVQDKENLYIYSNEANDWAVYDPASSTAPGEQSAPSAAEPLEDAGAPEPEQPEKTSRAAEVLKPQAVPEKSSSGIFTPNRVECKFHSSKTAELMCAGCKADICEECENLFNGKVLCPDCLKKEKSKYKTKTIIEIIAAAVLFIILAVLFYYFILK